MDILIVIDGWKGESATNVLDGVNLHRSPGFQRRHHDSYRVPKIVVVVIILVYEIRIGKVFNHINYHYRYLIKYSIYHENLQNMNKYKLI